MDSSDWSSGRDLGNSLLSLESVTNVNISRDATEICALQALNLEAGDPEGVMGKR